MASFSETTQYRGYVLQLDVNEIDTSVENNTSLVSWALYIINSSNRFADNFWYTVVIDGSERVNNNIWVDTRDADYHKPHLLASGSYTVVHNEDGSKAINCRAACSGGASGNGPGYGECGGWVELTTLVRAAKINSFSGNDIDNDFSVGYTKYVNLAGWVYVLRLSLSNNTVLDRVVYTSGTIYRLPDSAKEIIYNAAGNNDTINIKAVIETWNNGTGVGESSALTNTCNINRNMWLNVNNVWKRGVPYVNINGVWKKGIPYIKINGEWKKAI